MNDDRIVRLLEEVRDLQRQHLASYQEALRNQQEAIGIQRQATRRAFRIATVLIILVVVLVAVIIVPYVRRWAHAWSGKRVPNERGGAKSCRGARRALTMVVSNFCLHHIPSAAGRERACCEIARVLEPSGIGLISDYTNVEECAAAFARSGCTVTAPVRINFFPALRLFAVRRELASSSGSRCSCEHRLPSQHASVASQRFL